MGKKRGQRNKSRGPYSLARRKPICFGVTAEKYVSHRFWPNFANIERTIYDKTIVVGTARTDMARNQVVREFLQTNATHLLFLDSDQLFPPHIVERLLSHKKLVVGCVYVHRQKPYIPHCYLWSKTEFGTDGEPLCEHIPITPEDRRERRLIECDAIGTGGLMIARDVFTDIIEPPWFQYGGTEESEDITFCRKLSKKGIKVYCDAGCESGHLTEIVVGLDNYWANKEREESGRKGAGAEGQLVPSVGEGGAGHGGETEGVHRPEWDTSVGESEGNGARGVPGSSGEVSILPALADSR